jgi:membrane protease YdiL (CAAX protease family)
MDILLNSQHELRAGWKFLAYWFLFILVLFAVSVVIPISQAETQLQRLLLNTIPTVPAVAALLLAAKFVDRVPAATFGATLHEHWPRDFGVGIVVAIAMLAMITLINAAVGGISMVWTGSDATGTALLVTPIVLILSAAQEELVFRGYPLQILMKGIGEWPAILAMSGAFGLLHLRNPNATIIGAVNTMLAGVMLSVAYLKTRSLWLPYGLHLAWNVGLGFVLGYPLSGIAIPSLWTTVAGGPKWLAGTEYGPEGALCVTIAFTAATVFICRTRMVTISPKMHALLWRGVGPTLTNGEIKNV